MGHRLLNEIGAFTEGHMNNSLILCHVPKSVKTDMYSLEENL